MANWEAELNGATGNSAKEEGKNDAWKNVTLGFTRTYSPEWKPRHAFREVFQNLKDGIIHTFGLDEKRLSIEIRNSETEYIAEFRDANRKLLGFMKYSAGEGAVELANFGVSLCPEDLEVGYTTKNGAEKLAGGHGEGLKMAALVMLREGYRFQIQSSEHTWNFNFGGTDNRKIVCSFGWPKGQADEGYKEKYRRKFDKNSSEELKAHIWEDVSVKIGGSFRGKGAKVDYETFKSWLDVSVDLVDLSESDVIKTSFGDLILDKKYEDTIYLKGLRLEANPSLKKFKFGYNLLAGKTDRDRHGMMDMRQQAQIITRIWGEAIVNGNVDILDKYTEILRSEESWADVALVEEFISSDTASRLWGKLQRDDPEHKKFYYDQGKGDRDVEIIIQCLKKQPEPLPRRIWKPLYKFRQVVTPYERQCYLLQRCSEVAVVDTPYALGLTRAMRAILLLDTRTSNLTLSCRKGYTAGLGLLLDGSTLLIHDSWFDFRKRHEGEPCELTETTSVKDFNSELFSCGHVVIEWYRLVLNELLNRAGPNRIELEEGTRSLRAKVSQNLRSMPTSVAITQGAKPREIRVSWVDKVGAEAFKSHGLDLKCRITLHLDNTTCRQKKKDLLAPEVIFDDVTRLAENGSQSTAACGCPERIVSQMKGEAYFYNLDDEKAYFPMVASLSPKAFYSLPPEAVRPKESHSDSSYSYNRHTSREARPEPVGSDISGDTRGASSNSEDEMDVDTPQTTPSPQGPKNMTVPIQPLTGAPSFGTTARFDIHGNQFSHVPNQASQRENGLEIAQLKAVIRTRSEQMNVVKMRVQALAQKVQTNKQFRNLPVNLGANHRELPGNVREANGPLTDFIMEDSTPQSSPNPAKRVSAEIGQSRMVTDILNRRSQQIGLNIQSRGFGNQNAQNECSQNADEHQGYCAQTQEPLRPNEMLQGQLDTRTADTASESRRLENAQSETEASRKTIEELEAEKVALLAEVERLGHEICALKAENEKLKADCERPYVGLAAELQDILNLISNPGSDAQLPNMADTTEPAEAGDFTYLAGCKRGSLEEEGESSHGALKRLKQVEAVDYVGLASQ